MSNSIVMKTLNHTKRNAQKWSSQCVHSIAVKQEYTEVEPAKSIYDLPCPPGNLPIVGHLFSVLRKEVAEDLPAYFSGLRDKYGDIFRISMPGMGNGNMVMIFTPKDSRVMYKNDGRIPILPGFSAFEYSRKVTMSKKFPTAGLFTNCEEWWTVRKLVQQDMMRPKSAVFYAEQMDKIGNEVVHKVGANLDADGCYEVNRICQEFALESLAYVVLGSKLGTLDGSEDGVRLISLANQLGPIYQTLFFCPMWSLKFLPLYYRFVRDFCEFYDICENYLDTAMKNLEDDSRTLLSKFVGSCGKYSKIPLIMGIDSLFAGIETTGGTAAFLMYHLSKHPEVQEKLYDEICETIGCKGQLTETGLNQLKFTKAVQMESQRMLPAIWSTSRIYDLDVVLQGYSIPRGTAVVRVGAVTSMDPKNFDQPQKFLPERWLRGHKERQNFDSFSNLPFGHGSRSCIGQRFAKLELYTLMVKMVQNYRMEYVGSGDVKAMTKFVSGPDRPVKVKFVRRN